MWQRIYAVFVARGKEFVRDRASLSWNLVFPILVIIGFSFMFSDADKPLYHIGVIGNEAQPLAQVKHLEIVHYAEDERSQAVNKLRHHQLDLLLDPQQQRYWVNADAPGGYISEQLLLGLVARAGESSWQRDEVDGQAIRYVDWLLPGVLGMNMMFSGLFGVGFVVVRYRKNGVLKRLRATPLSAVEFLLAQILSRLVIMLVVTSVIFISMNVLFNFMILGSYALLVLIALLSALSLVSLGLVIASQTASEELASGLLNVISWPMMFLSGVWFSLEGSPPWLQHAAELLPLTHGIEAARAVMLDGATLSAVSHHLLILAAQSGVFLLIGAWRFRWQ